MAFSVKKLGLMVSETIVGSVEQNIYLSCLLIRFLQYFRNIEEMEWAIEHVKTYGKPVAATICVGPNGDEDGIPLGKDLFRNGQENSILTCPYVQACLCGKGG